MHHLIELVPVNLGALASESESFYINTLVLYGAAGF